MGIKKYNEMTERYLYKHPIRCKTLNKTFRGKYEAAKTLIGEGLANYSTPSNYAAAIGQCLKKGKRDRMGYEWEYAMEPHEVGIESLPYEPREYGQAVRCEELGLTWPSQQAACHWLGVDANSLAQAFKNAKGRACKYKGYTWTRVNRLEVKGVVDAPKPELRSYKRRGTGKLVCQELGLEFATVREATAYFNTYSASLHAAFKGSEVKDACAWMGYRWEWVPNKRATE